MAFLTTSHTNINEENEGVLTAENLETAIGMMRHQIYPLSPPHPIIPRYETTIRQIDQKIIKILRRLKFEEEFNRRTHHLKLQCLLSLTHNELAEVRSIPEFERLLEDKLDDIKTELNRFIDHLKSQIRET